MQSVGVFVGGYGISAIPTPSSEFLPQNPLQVCLRKSSHRLHRCTQMVWLRMVLQRIALIFTEASGGEYSLTDCTDFHRSRRVWHPCHTHAVLRIPSTDLTLSLLAQVLPRNSRNSQKFQAEDILPQISRNSQKLLAEDILPRISRNSQKFLTEDILPRISL